MKRREPTIKAALLAGVLALLFVQTAFLSDQAMAGMFGFLKRYDVHLCPEVRGRITLKGQPLSELTVTRAITYGKVYEDSAVTDANGDFHFPEKDIRSNIPGRLFDETRKRQVVYVDHDDQRYLLWHTVTDSIKPEKTASEKLKHLSCDLTSEEKLQHFPVHEDPSFTHNVHSICRWDSETL